MEVRNNKLQAKDLINVGIFTAIYFVVFFAGMMLGYIPIFIPLLGLVCPILCGIPFMLYLTKVKKFGMVSLTGIILGLLNVLIGAGVLVLIFGVVFGILGDLVLKAGKYQSWKCTLLGNGVFSLDYGLCEPYVPYPRRVLHFPGKQLWSRIYRHTCFLHPELDVPRSFCCDLHRRNTGGAARKSGAKKAL